MSIQSQKGCGVHNLRWSYEKAGIEEYPEQRTIETTVKPYTKFVMESRQNEKLENAPDGLDFISF